MDAATTSSCEISDCHRNIILCIDIVVVGRPPDFLSMVPFNCYFFLYFFKSK